MPRKQNPQNKPQEEQKDERGLPRKRGNKNASLAYNLDPNTRGEEIAKMVADASYFFGQPIVKTPEECAERLNWYFKSCTERQCLPTVESMALALGVQTKTLWDWETGRKGKDPAIGELVKEAKQVLASIDAQAASSGKIPQVVYIFRAKNFYGMKDQQEVVHVQTNPLDSPADQKELAEKYSQNAEIIDADYREIPASAESAERAEQAGESRE